MVEMYFGNSVSATVTLLALALLVWLGLVYARRGNIRMWGLRIAIAIALGTALSALSATRDSFMMSGAVFTMPGVQSLICMVLGVAIYLLGISALFTRRQPYRKSVFIVAAILLSLQIITVEGSRVLMHLGGQL